MKRPRSTSWAGSRGGRRAVRGAAPIGDPSVALCPSRPSVPRGPDPTRRRRWPNTGRAHRAGALFVPYLAVAWRLLGDPRWPWLEGDERLVGIYDLGEAVGPLDALADAAARACIWREGQPLDQSVRGGTQTEGALFARIEPEIRALRAALVAAVARPCRPAAAARPDPSHARPAARPAGPLRRLLVGPADRRRPPRRPLSIPTAG